MGQALFFREVQVWVEVYLSPKICLLSHVALTGGEGKGIEIHGSWGHLPVALLGGEMNRFYIDSYLPAMAVSVSDRWGRIHLPGGSQLLGLCPQEGRGMQLVFAQSAESPAAGDWK